MATGAVRTENELLEFFKDNTTQDIYPQDIRDFVATMFFEVSANATDSSYVYIGYADDSFGAGFTLIFDPLKDFIAIRATITEIPVPVVGDFTGLWVKYIGDQGVPGFSLLTGLVDPIIVDGSDGDTFLNTVSYDMFGPKSGGVWGSGTSIIGRGVDTVTLTGSVGVVDTYRMLFTDATFVDYTITNGVDGVDGTNGAIQNGINLGLTGASVFSILDISNNLTFRKINTNSSEITLTQNTNDIDIKFNNIIIALSISALHTRLSTLVTPLSPFGIFSIYGKQLIKFTGVMKLVANYTFTAGELLFKSTISINNDILTVVNVFDSVNELSRTVGIKISTAGNVTIQNSVSLTVDSKISFEDIIIPSI